MSYQVRTVAFHLSTIQSNTQKHDENNPSEIICSHRYLFCEIESVGQATKKQRGKVKKKKQKTKTKTKI